MRALAARPLTNPDGRVLWEPPAVPPAETQADAVQRRTHVLTYLLVLAEGYANRLVRHAGRGVLTPIPPDAFRAVAYLAGDFSMQIGQCGRWDTALPDDLAADPMLDPAAALRLLAADAEATLVNRLADPSAPVEPAPEPAAVRDPLPPATYDGYLPPGCDTREEWEAILRQPSDDLRRVARAARALEAALEDYIEQHPEDACGCPRCGADCGLTPTFIAMSFQAGLAASYAEGEIPGKLDD